MGVLYRPAYNKDDREANAKTNTQSFSTKGVEIAALAFPIKLIYDRLFKKSHFTINVIVLSRVAREASLKMTVP